ncbi:MAG: phosphoserine phosphatase SerB [Burkholderiaceae bacterium]
MPMKRLVLQHPGLRPASVNAFEQLLGVAPTDVGPRLAQWSLGQIDETAVRDLARREAIDWAVLDRPRRLADFGLMAFDMDSTVINIECIDEIADFAGRKAEVSAITAATMRGEIRGFEESLRQRVALLAGLPVQVLEQVYAERLQPNPGAEVLMAAARRAGVRLLLVSGGFTFFTERLRERLGFDWAHGNVLDIQDGRLTGKVGTRVIDAQAKLDILRRHADGLGLAPDATIAVGDGANDLLMMGHAGLSIAYHAKPVVQASTSHALNHAGLDGILGLFDDTRERLLAT